MNTNTREIIEQIERIRHETLNGDFKEAIYEIVDQHFSWEEIEEEIWEEFNFKALEDKLKQEEKVLEISECIFNALIKDLEKRVNFKPCLESMKQNPRKLKAMKKAWLELITEEIKAIEDNREED